MMGDNRDNSLDSRISPADGGVGFVPEKNLVARVDRLLLSRDPSVGWLDVGRLAACLPARRACSAASTERPDCDAAWRFGPASEADFEPLLALRIDVMREHLERVFRYEPERARRIFREHFDEPGLRLILVGDDERIGCVGFRIGADGDQARFLLSRAPLPQHGLGTAILKVLLAEADAHGLPIRLEVLNGSKADRFYLRHGFVKLSEDAIEATYERPVP